MNKVFSICLVLLFLAAGRIFSQNSSRESIAVDWGERSFDISLYIDSCLQTYEYYYVDYTVKENPDESVWKSQVAIYAYRDPGYVVVDEVHNYYKISHYFSNSLMINSRTGGAYSFSPYSEQGKLMPYLRQYNGIALQIYMTLRDRKVISTEKKDADLEFLQNSQKLIR